MSTDTQIISDLATNGWTDLSNQLQAAVNQSYIGGSVTSSRGVTIAPSATANTKGSYTSLITAANNTLGGSGLLVTLSINVGIVDLIDIAIGDVGSEVVIASNLLAAGAGAGTGTNRHVFTYFIPTPIAAATRISARAQQNSTTAQSIFVLATLLPTNRPYAKIGAPVTAYGVDAVNTRGTSIDPGGTANTKGSWVQISAATSSVISALSVGFSDNAVANALGNWLFDVGVGAAGSEQVVLPNLGTSLTGSTDPARMPLTYNLLPVGIPAGSRLAVRAQSSVTISPGRLLDVVLYAV